jgi:hypothetical protein
MSAYRVPMIVGVFVTAALCPANGRTQDTRSPLPFIAAPPNVGGSAAGSEAPIVEQPLARLRIGPPRIACWASPSNTCAYAGYYLGGGYAFCRGQPRFVTEGTWGWDYHGYWLPQRIFLQWSRGRFYQGGAGAYRIDGPPILKLLEERRQERSAPP